MPDFHFDDDDLDRLVRDTAVTVAGTPHPHRTAVCPTLGTLLAAACGDTAIDMAHTAACGYCQTTIARAWDDWCPPLALTLATAAPDHPLAGAIDAHSGGCSRCAAVGRLAPAPPTELGSARRRRAARQRRWLIGGTAAAAVAAAALLGGLVVQQSGGLVGGGGSATGDSSAEAEGATSRDTAGNAQSTEASVHEAPGPSDEARTLRRRPRRLFSLGFRRDRPVVLDREVSLPDEAAVLARYRNLTRAELLLATPLPQARQAADRSAAFLRRAPRLAGRVSPGDCLSALPHDAARPVVPARVETVVYRGEPALAYVLVSASDGASALDRVEVRILRRRDCSTALSLRL
jgi:hypothetical protein